MSVSRSALFTGTQPPWPLLADLHRVLDHLVEQLGIVAHRSDGPEARSRELHASEQYEKNLTFFKSWQQQMLRNKNRRFVNFALTILGIQRTLYIEE